MMLKINKTLPRNKTRQIDSCDTSNHHNGFYYVGLATLICGIMPGLMGLSYYGNNSNKASAARLSIDNISTMQEMRPGICHNMNIGDEKQLTDTRDNNTYTIRKLSDGKCWMVDNLRLAGGTTLSRADTNLDPSAYTTDEQTYTLPPATNEGGFSDAMFTDSNGAETYMNHQVRNSTDDDYGAYYSWCAATAGTCQIGSYADIQPKENEETEVYYTASPENTTIVPQYSQATSSICPKSWRLPTGGDAGDAGDAGDFQALYDIYPKTSSTEFQIENEKNGYWLGGASVVAGGAFFPAAGGVTSNGLILPNVFGRYWSSTSGNSTSAYNPYFDSTSISLSSRYYRFDGFTLRCLSDSYAEEDVNVIAVKVAPTISIDASTGANVEVDPNVVSTDGTITATISANTTYDVLLSADEPNLVSTTDTTKYIPASSNIAIRTNGWGILNDPNDSTRLSDYSAITTSPTTYYNTSSYDETKQQTLHTFSLGISIAPSLPSGTYSTTVTVTAVNN